MPKCIVILFHDFIDEVHIEIRTATYVHGDLMEEKIVEEFTVNKKELKKLLKALREVTK